MFSADINGSSINDLFRTENNVIASNSSQSSSSKESRETSTTDKTFQNDLQSKLNEQKAETFREKEKEKISYTFETPTKPIEQPEIKKLGLSEEEIALSNKTFQKIPVLNTKTVAPVTQKEQPQTTELEGLLVKLTSLLKKLDENNIAPSDNLNEVLASLAELLAKLSESSAMQNNKVQLTDTASKIKQIQLIDPRTKESVPITFISKKDLADLLNKISNELTAPQPKNENKDMVLKITELLAKLDGVIESSKNDSQVISQTIPIEPTKKEAPKLDTQNTQNDGKATKTPTEAIKVEAKEETKNTELNLTEAETPPQEIFTKKPVESKNKTEVSLVEQTEKPDAKALPVKMISLDSLDNKMNELNTKINIKEVKDPEAVPLLKNSSTNLEKQNQIMNQFRTYLTINKLKSDTEVNMRLYPRELGEVKVKITKEQIAGSENTQIVAKFQVSSAAVKAILESNFDALKNDLQQNSNISISSLSVEVNDKENKNKNFSEFYEGNSGKHNNFKTTEILPEQRNIVEQIIDTNEINSLA
jgi:flagellar hook-length control protein FliK